MNFLKFFTSKYEPSNDNDKKLDAWRNLIMESYPNGIKKEGYSLPDFPSATIQNNTVGCTAEVALQQAFEFYKIADGALQTRTTNTPPTILDFGCGWGRITRFFLRNTQQENIFGVDVEPSFIEICKNSFSSPNFSVIKPSPPTPFESGKFDLIVLYSVFSHLSESLCLEWIKEFHRILKPNGAVVFTTRSKNFFSYCESLKNSQVPYQASLSKLFPDFTDAKDRYQKGQFVFSGIAGVGGGGAMNNSFYGESFIPEQYVQSHYCTPNLFQSYFRIQPDGHIDQETFILYK